MLLIFIDKTAKELIMSFLWIVSPMSEILGHTKRSGCYRDMKYGGNVCSLAERRQEFFCFVGQVITGLGY